MGRKKYLIVMAAGSGTRMGVDMPKQFIELEGKAILRRTIEVFQEACPDINVVTVLPEAHISYWRNYCLENNFVCPQVIVKGGITRFHSVKNALAKVPEGAVVAVHDGVRPLVSAALIKRMFDMCETVEALIPVIPCVDTMKVLEKKGGELVSVPGATIDRSVLFGAQTPQVFHSEILKEAYTLPYDTAFTDDASVVEALGEKVYLVEGNRENIKLTTPFDLKLAEMLV